MTNNPFWKTLLLSLLAKFGSFQASKWPQYLKIPLFLARDINAIFSSCQTSCFQLQLFLQKNMLVYLPFISVKCPMVSNLCCNSSFYHFQLRMKLKIARASENRLKTLLLLILRPVQHVPNQPIQPAAIQYI